MSTPGRISFKFCILSGLFATLTFARPQSYAVWAADSAIARGQGNGLDSSGRAVVSYEHGELQWGLRQLFERTGNRTYFNYIQRGVDNIVFDNGTVHGSYTYVFVYFLYNIVSRYSIDDFKSD